jgi:hypothetical protein
VPPVRMAMIRGFVVISGGLVVMNWSYDVFLFSSEANLEVTRLGQ